MFTSLRALRPLVVSLFLSSVTALLQCPENPGWEVIDSNGGSGGRWKIPGDFSLIRTPLKAADGSLNGTWMHIAVNLTLASAFDKVKLPCYGETITNTAGNFTDENPGSGFVNGTCSYDSTGMMGSVETHFEYNLDYRIAEFYAYQDFACNRTTNGRPWRVRADCLNKEIDLSCDDSGLICGSPYPYDMGVYYVPIFPPAPLTNCSAGVLSKNVPFIVTNISYNSVQSSPEAPVLGAAYVVLTMPLIDFTMRCLPSGDEMAYTWNGTSDTWYDCKADFTNPDWMPPTWVKFNRSTFEVTVRQEFSCDDADKLHPQYVTAQGSAIIPKECADTWDGVDCWSTRVATIYATEVTHSTTRPAPHSMPIKVADKSRDESRRLALDLLIKANVVQKEMLRPADLTRFLGSPI